MEYQREGSEVRVLFPALGKEYTSDSQPSCHTPGNPVFWLLWASALTGVCAPHRHTYIHCVCTCAVFKIEFLRPWQFWNSLCRPGRLRT